MQPRRHDEHEVSFGKTKKIFVPFVPSWLQFAAKLLDQYWERQTEGDMTSLKNWMRATVLFVLAGSGLAFFAAPSAQQATAIQQAPSSPILATATPESVGMSADRLQRLHQGMQGFVDRHEVGGIVTLIARDGKIADLNAVGFQDVENRTAMKPETIFRIASMSK